MYGDMAYQLDMQPARRMEVIRPAVLPPALPAGQLVTAALDNVCEIIAGFKQGERVVIVTSDITRYTGSEYYLPLLVERLNAAGIRDRDIEIVIALGIHRKQTEHEHKKIVGSLYGRIKVTDHDCDDPGKLVFVGKTGNGIEVELNRAVMEADRRILTGTIGFHYFAGFGGGRKAILPGVASRQACMASHFTVLNRGEGSGKNPNAATGILAGNPVHTTMVEACAMAKPDMLLNTVLSPDKQIMAVFAGDWRDAHEAGCRYYAEHFSFPLREKADLVVVSCGGFPKDINFIQAHKSMEYGCQALKDDGVLVLLAQCRDGYGHQTFFDWFRHKELPEFEAALRNKYEINGQTAYATLQKAKRFRVILVSSLPAKEVTSMSMISAVNLDDAMQKAEAMLPQDYTAYIIPEGGMVLPVHQGKGLKTKG